MRNLADPALTTFERREYENEIKQTMQLRSILEMMSDRSASERHWSRRSASLNSASDRN